MKVVLSIAAIATLLLTGCGEESKKEVQKSEPVAVEEATQEEKIEAVKELTASIVNEVVDDVKDTTVKMANEVSDKATDIAADVKDEANSVVDSVMATAKESVTAVKALAIDGGAIYKGCTGCHGANGEKVALGKSKVIQGWDASKVVEALNGYKDGSYGGAMKGLMKGQASKLSDDEIKAVSDYISKL